LDGIISLSQRNINRFHGLRNLNFINYFKKNKTLTMPGTIVFKPIEANLQDQASPVNPYCIFTMGNQRLQSKSSEKGGDHPYWDDSIIMKTHDNQPRCFVEVKGKQEAPSSDNIGSFEVDLSEVEMEGRLKKWYPFFEKDKMVGEILMEATYTPDKLSEESSIHQKAHQGSLPHGIDLDEYAREGMRWRAEPANSLAKIAETNEFGDYQPMKQLSTGDVLRERGSGWIGQGMYYSGQQTSYGEDFPMAHKSVGTNLLGSYQTDHGAAYDRGNPRDFALFQQQAFEPVEFRTTFDMNQNTSVVEKAFEHYQREEKNFQRGFPREPAPKLSMGTRVEPEDTTNEEFFDSNPSGNEIPPQNVELMKEEQHKEAELWESPLNIQVDKKIIDETNDLFARNYHAGKMPRDVKTEMTARDLQTEKDFRDLKDRAADRSSLNQPGSTRPGTAFSESLSTAETHWDI